MGHIRQVVANRFNYDEMHCEGKLKFRSHNTSYCLIEMVTKADLTVHQFIWVVVCLSKTFLIKIRRTCRIDVCEVLRLATSLCYFLSTFSLFLF
jgi:hypothetical protein